MLAWNTDPSHVESTSKVEKLGSVLPSFELSKYTPPRCVMMSCKFGSSELSRSHFIPRFLVIVIVMSFIRTPGRLQRSHTINDDGKYCEACTEKRAVFTSEQPTVKAVRLIDMQK